MNRCSAGGVEPGLGPVSGLLLNAGCVRRTGLPDFNGVLSSPLLSTGNYGREKAIRQSGAAQRGGQAHAQQGGEYLPLEGPIKCEAEHRPQASVQWEKPWPPVQSAATFTD